MSNERSGDGMVLRNGMALFSAPQPGGLRESSRRSKRSVDLRNTVDGCSHSEGVPALFWHPSRVRNNFPLSTGGLRYASTTGYYLSRLRRGVSTPLLALFLGCLAQISAQQIGNPTTQEGVTPPRGLYAIRNARIVTVSGPEIENGTIVIRDGKIEALGTNISVPSDAQTIDAKGLSVYPGMIDAGTSLGLVEVGQGAPGTVDTSEVGELNPNA
ncbi:MAG: hypothetical protein ABI923_05050, partial [bacterium]